MMSVRYTTKRNNKQIIDLVLKTHTSNPFQNGGLLEKIPYLPAHSQSLGLYCTKKRSCKVGTEANGVLLLVQPSTLVTHDMAQRTPGDTRAKCNHVLTNLVDTDRY